MRFLLLAAGAAPFILAWIIVREHQLSWPRGQVTSVVAIAAIGLIFYTGIVDRPGDPSSAISLKWGWFVAALGAILMLVGSVMRQQETEVRRKPPGTL
jgi:bacteriorhodopsin